MSEKTELTTIEALHLAYGTVKDAEREADYTKDHWGDPEEDRLVRRLERAMEREYDLAKAVKELFERMEEMGFGTTSELALPGEYDYVARLVGISLASPPPAART